MGLTHITLAEKDYAIIFSSTFDPMPHKNLYSWSFKRIAEKLLPVLRSSI